RSLRSALQQFLHDGRPPDPGLRAGGAFAYPELRLVWPTGKPYPRLPRAYARTSQPGHYAVPVARPELSAGYPREQLTLLTRHFGVEVSVARSRQEIPFPYVLDGSDLALAGVGAAAIAQHFPATELAFIGDEVVDGLWSQNSREARPLALFDALRTDF